MSEVVKVDFGKEEREAARIFCRLLGLIETYEEKVLSDPLPYLQQAHDEIFRLRKVIFDADGVADSWRRIDSFWVDGPVVATPGYETVRVFQDEYEALKRCAMLVHDEVVKVS